MKKRVSYYVFFCFLPVALTACHRKADESATFDTETAWQESHVLDEETRTDVTFETKDDRDISESREGKANSSETEKIIDSFMESETSQITDYVLTDSDSRLYRNFELEGLSLEQMKLARNEIYARHGRKFKDHDLQIFFQSKPWYQGTVEPDEFDDAQLNETERYNLKLLLLFEQGKKREVQESKIEINGLGKTNYAVAVNENQYRKLYLTTEETFDNNEQIRSQIIDHGSYYEVTHGCIMADSCYDRSVMEGKDVGDTLVIGETVYRITEISLWSSGNGEDVFLEYISGPKKEYFFLSRNYTNNYYLMVAEDAVTDKDILYTGSLYFSKDCVTIVLDPENEFRQYLVTISDYFTKEVRSQWGVYSFGRLFLWGDFSIDPSGLITSYTEYFLP